MKRKYLRLVRRAYRYLRHPRIRNRPWLLALTKPLYDRELWNPCRYTVAGGCSVGLFCAMLPIPFQMLLAAIGCMKLRVNIPIAMAACWISNPFTHPPLILLQLEFGEWIRRYIHIELPFDQKTHIHFLEYDVTGSPADFFVGCLMTAIILGLLAYPLVYGVSFFLPNKGKRIHKIKQRRKNKHPLKD